MEEYRVEPVTQKAFDIIFNWLVLLEDEEAHTHAGEIISDLESAGYVIALVEPQGN